MIVENTLIILTGATGDGNSWKQDPKHVINKRIKRRLEVMLARRVLIAPEWYLRFILLLSIRLLGLIRQIQLFLALKSGSLVQIIMIHSSHAGGYDGSFSTTDREIRSGERTQRSNLRNS